LPKSSLKGYGAGEGSGEPPAQTGSAEGTEAPPGTAEQSEAPPFVDVPDYAVADVALVASLGLMSGYAGGEFRPWQGAPRSQVAVTMSRYLALPASPPAN
jgi:S-layer homology domain